MGRVPVGVDILTAIPGIELTRHGRTGLKTLLTRDRVEGELHFP
jgi:hypothetical protein